MKQWSSKDGSGDGGWMDLADCKEKGPAIAKILIAREWD